jgi:hypothetical protein
VGIRSIGEKITRCYGCRKTFQFWNRANKAPVFMMNGLPPRHCMHPRVSVALEFGIRALNNGSGGGTTRARSTNLIF